MGHCRVLSTFFKAKSSLLFGNRLYLSKGCEETEVDAVSAHETMMLLPQVPRGQQGILVRLSVYEQIQSMFRFYHHDNALNPIRFNGFYLLSQVLKTLQEILAQVLVRVLKTITCMTSGPKIVS